MKKELLATFAILAITKGLTAQTTLSGDHIITGDLDVGTSGTKGNLKITSPTGSTTVPSLSLTGDGGVIFAGSMGSGSFPTSAATAQFIWYPKKAAFVGGNGVVNDENYLGDYSFSFGEGAYASGQSSASFGSSTASGSYAFSAGNSAASDQYSTAMGFSTASGQYSTAMGQSTSSGNSSTAMGYSSANGEYSVAGGRANANAAYSLAMGEGETQGEYSIALGQGRTGNNAKAALSVGEGTWANGRGSVALGVGTSASPYVSVAIGAYNKDYIYIPDDFEYGNNSPLLMVGNGDASAARNAFEIFRDGEVFIYGASSTVPAIVLDPQNFQIRIAGQSILAPNSSGNIGLGTSSPSAYYYGGTNRVVEITNSATAANSQSHLILSTGATTSAGSAGSLSWMAPNATTQKGIASITGLITTGSATAPQGALSFSTSNGTGNPIERMRLTSDGRLGLGTSTPETILDVRSSNNAGIIATAYGATDAIGVVMRRARGSISSPSAVQLNDAIGGSLGRAYNGSTFTTASSGLIIRAGQNWTPAANGTYITLETTANGSTARTEKVRITGDGKMGIGTSAPQATLDVSGTMKVSGDVVFTQVQGDISMGEFAP